ncbi:hypothetical protein KA082_01190 [Candidatus Woesebacteria bacterium]|nr:hypothetical protein [Candidatus Woesebacteria bacterium]
MTKKTTDTPDTKKSEQEASAPALIGKNTVVTITIPWATAEGAYKKAKQKVASTAKIAGFRKGKVPADVAEKMLGVGEIIEKAIEFVLPEAYKTTLEKEKKLPLTQPAFRGVRLELGSDWIIEAEIAEKPAITLGDYKKAVVEAGKHVAEDLAAASKKTDSKEETDGGQIPQTLTPEQEKDFKLQHIYRHLIEAIKPQVPELLVRREVEYDIEQLGQQLQSIKMPFEDYLKRRGITQDQLTQQMALSALGRLQLLFIVDALARENKLEASDADITAYIEQKVEPTIREQYIHNEEYRQMVAQTIVRQKVADQLLAI